MAVLLGRAAVDKVSEQAKPSIGTGNAFASQTLRSASSSRDPTALACCCNRELDESVVDENPVSLIDDAVLPPRGYLGRKGGMNSPELAEALGDDMAPNISSTGQPQVAEQRVDGVMAFAREDAEVVTFTEHAREQRCEANFTFNVLVNKHLAEGLGMDLDKMDENVMIVSSIKKEGLIALWNETCCEEGCPEKAVQNLDRLTHVNGEGGTGTILYRSILRALQAMHLNNRDLVLSFERPRFCTVSVGQGKSMGVSLSINDEAHGIPILDVMDGAMRDCLDFQVKPHDRIVQVNGIEMAPKEMVALMKDSSQAFTARICSYDVRT